MASKIGLITWGTEQSTEWGSEMLCWCCYTTRKGSCCEYTSMEAYESARSLPAAPIRPLQHWSMGSPPLYRTTGERSARHWHWCEAAEALTASEEPRIYPMGHTPEPPECGCPNRLWQPMC